MVKRNIILAFLILMATAIAVASFAGSQTQFPEVKRPVNDYANILSPADEYALSRLMVEHRKNTGVQIAVVTVWTTGNLRIEEYSLGTAEKWGGGKSGRDDGLLFLIAVGDRKMRLEVGYGLEGYVPDFKAFRLLESIKGDFRSGAYGAGVLKVIRGVIDETRGIPADAAIPASGKLKGFLFHGTGLYVILFLLSGIIGALYVIVKQHVKLKWPVLTLIFALLWVGGGFLLQLLYPGAWYWRPIVFVTGAFAGGSLAGPFYQRNISLRGKIVFAIIAMIIAGVSFGFIFNCLDIMKPNPVGTTAHETLLLVILIWTNIFQALLFFMLLGDITKMNSGSGGDYYQSTYSSGSGSSSSSSGSSSNDNWSGGGGSFGGGGASSSW